VTALRDAISKYETSCETVLSSFPSLMSERRANVELAAKSLQVVNKANDVSIGKDKEKSVAKDLI